MAWERSGDGGPGQPPSGPPSQVEAAGKRGGGLLGALIVVGIVVAGAGFFSHLYLDLFSWAWDLWADLIA